MQIPDIGRRESTSLYCSRGQEAAHQVLRSLSSAFSQTLPDDHDTTQLTIDKKFFGGGGGRA